VQVVKEEPFAAPLAVAAHAALDALEIVLVQDFVRLQIDGPLPEQRASARLVCSERTRPQRRQAGSQVERNGLIFASPIARTASQVPSSPSPTPTTSSSTSGRSE